MAYRDSILIPRHSYLGSRPLGSRAVIAGLAALTLAMGACKRDTSDYAVLEPMGDGSTGTIARTVSDMYIGMPPEADASAVSVADAPLAKTTDGGGSGGDLMTQARLTVTIDDPIKDGVVPAATPFRPGVTILLDLSQGAAPDQIKEVAVAVLVPDSGLPKPVGAMPVAPVAGAKLSQRSSQTQGERDVFQFKFGDTPVDLSGAATGRYELVVTVTTSGGMEIKDKVSFLLDAGPTIRIESPGDGKFYRGGTVAQVLIEDKTFGPLKDIQAFVANHEIKLMGPGGPSGNIYTANIDFNAYMPPLEGPLLLNVTAKNKNNTGITVGRKFTSDRSGPEIKNTTPKNGEIIGRVITISADITDLAGVQMNSAVAVVAHGEKMFEVRLQPPAAGMTGSVYSALFDTNNLPINAIYPSISFRASDVLGNESSVGYLVALDNMPPISELDPPNIRGMAKLEERWRCSWPFDPVGPDAVDDGDLVAQVFDIRARVEDMGNVPLSGSVDYTPISAVPAGNVKLLLLDDVTQPLVVNTNPSTAAQPMVGDDLCDNINPLLVPTTTPRGSKDALLINMVPMEPGGTLDTSPLDEASMAEGCPIGSGKQPDPSCYTTFNSSKATYAFSITPGPHNYAMQTIMHYANGPAGKLPSIWTVPPYAAGEKNLQCGGTQLDTLGNNISDGWMCAVVQSTDRLGNMQVSRPLRICVDKDGDRKECPHRKIISVSSDTPMVVETKDPHGLTAGVEIRLQDVEFQTQANARWKVEIRSPTTFALVGSVGEPRAPNGTTGQFVKWADLPDCTGTVTAAGPPATVDAKKACKPWRLYPAKGERWVAP